jgi:peptide/nickel transport system substrate-binding protein
MQKRKSVIASLLAVTSMVLSACGPAAGPTPQGTTGPTQTPVVVVVTAEGGGGGTIVVTATPEPTAEPASMTSKDPSTYVAVTIGAAETFDPALDYETAGGGIVQNVYETLVFYDREHPDQFIAQLAEEVPTVENGGVSADGLTYTFKIRKGVMFHDGSEMTPEDVAYSFQRGLLQGGTSSPQWLYYEALFGTGTDDISLLVDPEGSLYDDREALKAFDAAALMAACEQVQAAIKVDGDTVVMTLSQPWGPWLATIAGPWGSTMSMKWAVENGAWDGDCATWQDHYAMSSDEINATALGTGEMGTGPFVLDTNTPGEETILKAFDGYWRTEPMWADGPSGVAALKTVIIKYVDEFSTRLEMFRAGDADSILVGSTNYAQADPLVGESCTDAGECAVEEGPAADNPIRVYKGLPSTARTDAFLNLAINIEGGNNFVGSGALDGNGVPPDFFSDIHIRRGFAYCFDWDVYIAETLNGEAVQSKNVMIPGMIGYDDASDFYSFDLEKCKAEFEAAELKSADGKSVMETGFRLSIAYNTGNTTRQTISQIFQTNLAEVNPLFVIEVTGLPWPTFLQNQRAQKLPIFVSGWQEDIHDPHNWLVPYALGTYASRQSLPDDLKTQFREIIGRGVNETDSDKRAEIYSEFNQLYYDNLPTILLAVQLTRRYEQRWVQGWYYNPIYPGAYYYPMSKK